MKASPVIIEFYADEIDYTAPLTKSSTTTTTTFRDDSVAYNVILDDHDASTVHDRQRSPRVTTSSARDYQHHPGLRSKPVMDELEELCQWFEQETNVSSRSSRRSRR